MIGEEPMAKNIMEFQHVSKQYDDNIVLRDISFEIEAGKFYTLLGPSGSGKTTILRLIAGFDHTSAGDIYFDGQRINDVPANQRQVNTCLLYTSPSPRDGATSRMPSSA